MANDNAHFSGNSINAGAIMGEAGTISGGNIKGGSHDATSNVQGKTEGEKDWHIYTTFYLYQF